MMKQIYTHLRSPLGLIAMAIVTIGAISAVKYVPLKAQVNTETTCPVGEKCCWHIDNNSCVRDIYQFSPFQTPEQYCQNKAKPGRPWYQTYNECSTGETTPEPVCGNGDIEGDEQCDDGNDDNTDGCIECRNARCGDDIRQLTPVNEAEECDDGNNDDNDNCYECKNARCGDGVKQPTNNEECDDGDKNGLGLVLSDRNYSCSASCKKITTQEDNNSNDDNDRDTSDDNDSSDQGDSNDQSNDNDTPVKDTDSTPVSEPIVIPATPKNDDTPKPVNTAKPDTTTPSTPRTTNTPASNKTEAEKKAEEKRQEEQKKVLEDILQKSLDNANQQNTQENNKEDTVLEDTTESQKDTKIEPVVQQQNVIKEDQLRCIDADGKSTTDRTKCDYQKEQEVQKPVVIDIPEPEIKKQIRENILGSDIVQRRSDALLVTLRDLRTRTANIANGEEFNDEVETYLQDVLDWLDRGIEYFSSQLRSLEDITKMTQPVRQLAEQTSVLIKQQKNLPMERPDINPILTKTDTLLAKFRESFIALAQGQVALPAESLQVYVDAVNLYDTIKPLCLEDADQCNRINEVLEKLKLVQTPLQEALEANPEIYKAVQEKFE